MAHEKDVLDSIDELFEDSAEPEEETQDNLEEQEEEVGQPEQDEEEAEESTEEPEDETEEAGAPTEDNSADEVQAQLDALRSERDQLAEQNKNMQSLHDRHYNQLQDEIKLLKEALTAKPQDNQPEPTDLDFADLDPEVAFEKLQKSLPTLVEQRAAAMFKQQFPELVQDYQRQQAAQIEAEENALASRWQEDLDDTLTNDGLSEDAKAALYGYMREHFEEARSGKDPRFVAKARRHALKATAKATHQTTKDDKKKLSKAVKTTKQKKSDSELDYENMTDEEILELT